MTSKAVLVPVDPQDIAVGRQLPWALYGRNGALIAPAGFMVGDEGQRQRVLAVRVFREAPGLERTDDATTQTEVRPHPGQTADALSELRHNVEFVQLTYHLKGEVEPATVPVEFIGKVTMQAVVISAPPLPGRQTWRDVEDGFPLSVRMMTGRSAYSFDTLLMRFSALPMAHLFLRYPSAVKHQVLRGAVRLRASVKAIAVLSDGRRQAVLIDNISGDGCGIDTDMTFGEPGETFELVFRIQVRGQGYTLTLPSTIRNKRSRKGRLVYGIQFGNQSDPLDQSLRLALEAYLYERIVSE